MKFYGVEFKYVDSIPEITSDDIRIFSSHRTKKDMINIMQRSGIKLDNMLKQKVAKIFTQFSIIKTQNEFGIITDIASK